MFQQQRLTINHYEQGETVLRKDQIGRTFYIILKGEVEVIASDTKGAESVVAKLGEREVFGEKALLEDTPRTATVRAVGAVDVLVMSRGDLRSMVTSFPVLYDHFAKLLRERHPHAMATMPEELAAGLGAAYRLGPDSDGGRT